MAARDSQTAPAAAAASTSFNAFPKDPSCTDPNSAIICLRKQVFKEGILSNCDFRSNKTTVWSWQTLLSFEPPARPGLASNMQTLAMIGNAEPRARLQKVFPKNF